MNGTVETPRTSPAAPRAHARLQLDHIKETIWLTRPDLRALVDGDRDHFEWLLAANGAKEYRALAELGATLSEDILIEPAAEALPQVHPVLTRFMKLMWSTRSDLRQAFDIDTAEGQQKFVWWYYFQGLGELAQAAYLTNDQRGQLNEPAPHLADTSFLPITRLMVEVWSRRPDLQQAFNLQKAAGREAFLAWYFTRGLTEFNLAEVIDAHQARALLSASHETPQVPKILALIWAADGPLQERFPDITDPLIRDWARGEEGQAAYPVLRRLKVLSQRRAAAMAKVHGAPIDLPFGVNLIGYAKGEFGIGEDVRMAARALEVARVPFSIYNVEPGREVSQGDNRALKHVSARLPYAVNIFCTTGIETARLAAVYGSKLFDGRRSVGYWPWELPEWPTAWHHAYSLVDEVWASSRFTRAAFAKSCPKPVRHMPMAVTVDQTNGLTRPHFQLPEDCFLFVFSFDFLSSLARKNPEACVTAFRQAFPHGDEPVGLVVKAMRATDDNPLWQALVSEAKVDRRITIINHTLNRGGVLDLYRVCDCYVSLHRSEGFGRGMAEAMMLGKPVIATGFSGNMDFTREHTAGLVNHQPCQVGEDDYPFGAGSTWAEPDIEHAAWWMRRMANERDLCTRLVPAARRLTHTTYAPAAVGRRYREILKKTVNS